MKMRGKGRMILAAAACLAWHAASADDYASLVSLVSNGPSGGELSEMVAGVTGKKREAVVHAAPVRLGLIADAMGGSETGLDGVMESMMMTAVLDAASRSASSSSGMQSDISLKRNFTMTSIGGGTLPLSAAATFTRPVLGRVTSGFGYRAQFGRVHKGVDLHLNVGDTVRAAMTGVVERVGYEAAGYGNYVVITHSDGVETRYGHLQRPLVVKGELVYAGDAVALGGNTGNSTGPHLHFETRVMGVAVDPTTLFDFSSPMAYKASMIVADAAVSERQLLHTGFKAAQKSASLADQRTYVVRDGDTPRSVARRAGISVSRLCQLNMLSEQELLTPGRMLKLR